MTIKRILCEQRLRRMPARFSWVDQRLVFDAHLQRCDASAAALYLVLVTVADVQGLSYWGDARLGQLLHMSAERLGRARDDLVGAGLIAYERPLYQVLALDAPAPAAAAQSVAVPSTLAQAIPVANRQESLQRLAQLRSHLAARR
jgi:hypothetical protein